MSRNAEPRYVDMNFVVGVLEDLIQANQYIPEEPAICPIEEAADEAYYRGKVAAYSCILDMLKENK